MYAIARLNTFRELSDTAELDRFAQLHARQPGYVGTLTVRIDQLQRLTLNLWQTEEDARRGLATLAPEVGRVLAPLMLVPSRLVGAGPVLDSDMLQVLSARAEGGQSRDVEAE